MDEKEISKAKKIAILGGTFDPPHMGHLASAKTVYDKLDVDEVWLMPCAMQPLKGNKVQTTAQDRLNMTKILAEESGYGWLRVEDSDITRGGVSYTVETLERLKTRHPDTQFVWVVGSDNLDTFDKWHRVDELAGLAQVAVVERPGYPEKETCLPYVWVSGEAKEMASSNLRSWGKDGAGFLFGVGEKVHAYIRKHNLYENPEIKPLNKPLKPKLEK